MVLRKRNSVKGNPKIIVAYVPALNHTLKYFRMGCIPMELIGPFSFLVSIRRICQVRTYVTHSHESKTT